MSPKVSAPAKPGLNEISSQQLMRLIGTPDAPVIIDVRLDDDFAREHRLVPTALRIAHENIADIAPQFTGTKAVVICHKGRKLSHGAAAILRQSGIDAQSLAGGIVSWIDAGLPTTPPDIPTLWVTRHRPKIDRIACPWLIRRFVQPNARFLFVPPAEVLGVAERFNATPFDVPDVTFSHRGDRCTFDTMIAEFGLTDPALLHLADVVRAADTNTHDVNPQAAGLLAISVGLSRMYRDDLAQLKAAMVLYDALYRWARDGRAEGHEWPPEGKV